MYFLLDCLQSHKAVQLLQQCRYLFFPCFLLRFFSLLQTLFYLLELLLGSPLFFLQSLLLLLEFLFCCPLLLFNPLLFLFKLLPGCFLLFLNPALCLLMFSGLFFL